MAARCERVTRVPRPIGVEAAEWQPAAPVAGSASAGPPELPGGRSAERPRRGLGERRAAGGGGGSCAAPRQVRGEPGGTPRHAAGRGPGGPSRRCCFPGPAAAPRPRPFPPGARPAVRLWPRVARRGVAGPAPRPSPPPERLLCRGRWSCGSRCARGPPRLPGSRA